MATWSGIRNKLETQYLAESLRGHIQYFATSYRQSHDQLGRAAIRYDGNEILSGSYFLKDFHSDRDPYFMDDFALKTGGFYIGDFSKAFHEFDNQNIEDSLNSENLLVRIFAVLDRRVGKRKLLAMKNKISEEPEMFQLFYCIRLAAEGIE